MAESKTEAGMKLLKNWLFWQFQKRCTHDPEDVSADILEGGGKTWAVMWCRRCGAYRQARELGNTPVNEWRTPRATWTGTGR